MGGGGVSIKIAIYDGHTEQDKEYVVSLDSELLETYN